MIYAGKERPVLGNFDLVIVGAGPAGIAAALSARREGIRVALIERAGVVGGNLTVGHVGPILGLYPEHTLAAEINRLIGGHPHKAHDAEYAKIRLTSLLAEEDIPVYLNTSLVDVILENHSIRALVLAGQSGPEMMEGRLFIDATGDGVLSYLCGEEIMMGREDGLVQPASVMFTVGGIDPGKKILCEHEEMDTQLSNGSYFDLTRKAQAEGRLPENVGIVRLYNSVYEDRQTVNATQVHRLNPLIPMDYNAAQVDLRHQIELVFNFLRETVDGYQNIKVIDSSDIVGFRESRRVRGHYIVTAEDLFNSVCYPDTVVSGVQFCIDIHNPTGSGQAESNGCPIHPGPYKLPYRAFVPLHTHNLLTAGRCISGTHRAHASYRVMNICMCMGEAVGAAAALCKKEQVLPAFLDVSKLQNSLLSRGIPLWD